MSGSVVMVIQLSPRGGLYTGASRPAWPVINWRQWASSDVRGLFALAQRKRGTVFVVILEIVGPDLVVQLKVTEVEKHLPKKQMFLPNHWPQGEFQGQARQLQGRTID